MPLRPDRWPAGTAAAGGPAVLLRQPRVHGAHVRRAACGTPPAETACCACCGVFRRAGDGSSGPRVDGFALRRVHVYRREDRARCGSRSTSSVGTWTQTLGPMVVGRPCPLLVLLVQPRRGEGRSAEMALPPSASGHRSNRGHGRPARCRCPASGGRWARASEDAAQSPRASLTFAHAVGSRASMACAPAFSTPKVNQSAPSSCPLPQRAGRPHRPGRTGVDRLSGRSAARNDHTPVPSSTRRRGHWLAQHRVRHRHPHRQLARLDARYRAPAPGRGPHPLCERPGG